MTNSQDSPLQAILIIGPTGSGKTPLGQHAQSHGFHGRCCSHFDFGHKLRSISSGKTSIAELSITDKNLIKRVISGGALLEDQHFHIAQAILADHIRKNHIDKNSSIILNGLPRHPGQARDIENQIEVINIINLHCSPQTVFQRIYANSGGDRTDRPDDTRDLIAAKLKIFDERTRPLLQYYAQQKVPITTITVTTKSTPQEIWENFLEQSSSPHHL